MVEVGFGQRDITPPVGAPLSGFIARHNRPSTSLDAPLMVRCLALRDQGQIYLLFSYDLVGIPAPIEFAIFGRLTNRLGLQLVEANCVLAATHNHSGPVLGLLNGEPAPDPTYVELLAERSAQAASLALENLQPAELFGTERRLPGLTYNRRAVLADGRVSISPQPDGPVLERGPLDDRLTLLLWRSPQGKALAGLVHFACHGVGVLSQAIGPDIPGELAGRIGELVGAPCLYLQGAAGDVNPTTVTASRGEMLEWVERAMSCLGDLSSGFKPVPLSGIQIVTSWLPFEYAGLPDEPSAVQTLQGLTRIARGDLTSPDLGQILLDFKNTLNLGPTDPLEPSVASHMAQVLAESAQRTVDALQSGRPLPPQYMHIKLWRLGDATLAFLSAEIFSATGARLRGLSQKWTVLTVSCLAPLLGYLPDRKAIGQGGYEAEDAWRFYGHPAPFAPDSEERLVARVQSMLTQLGD